MQTKLGHLVFGVATANMAFYRDLFGFLGWQTVYENPEMLGVGAGGVSLWFGLHIKDVGNDYDGPGVNHVAIAAESIADVDSSVAYLQHHGVRALFETPRHRPEFASADDQTYYQVMFESPDRILFEFVYTGPKDRRRLIGQ
jgi:catechol 2,3-dioxygenase-like lactoylglutathione lyase family enzyme